MCLSSSNFLQCVLRDKVATKSAGLGEEADAEGPNGKEPEAATKGIRSPGLPARAWAVCDGGCRSDDTGPGRAARWDDCEFIYVGVARSAADSLVPGKGFAQLRGIYPGEPLCGERSGVGSAFFVAEVRGSE